MGTTLRIELLGGFGVTVGGEPVPDRAWRLRKARTVVKLLALAPGRRLHREQLIAELWGDRDPAAAANNLHQVLHAARRAGVDVRLSDDVVALPPAAIDAEEFRSEALAALRSGDPERAAAALASYRGPLLPEDLYADWTEPERGELERLRDELSALSAPRQSRNDNLPAEATTFVGRAADLKETGRLLQAGRLVTLTGAAGCGKTRLALAVAAQAREAFRDGVWFVELASLDDEERVADAIAAAVGLQPLAQHELLLVLDNCEHLVAGCAAVAEELVRSCPDVRVLATSREPLAAAGEVVQRIGPLPLDDAVRLFADRAAAADSRFALDAGNARAAERICRRLDGVPLAIELAAARVGALAPAELADRLGDSLRLIGGRTLEAALDWSYRLLDAEEARLLRALAVFAGSFGIDAAETMYGPDALLVLIRLAEKSLVVVEGARYRLLEMVRHYAGERLEPDARERLRDRHARFYACLAETAPPARLDHEADDLRAALAWLQERDPPAALRLAVALGEWWLLRGRHREGLELVTRAAARSPQTSQGVADALLLSVGFIIRTAGLVEARRTTERALALYRELGDPAGTGRALHVLGLQAVLLGNYAEARAHLEEAGPSATAAQALAVLAIATDELPRARTLLEETLECLPPEPGLLVVHPGWVQGVHEETLTTLRHATTAAQAAAYLRLNLALVARLEGRADEAATLIGAALAGLQACGDEAGVAQALAAAGRLATLQGDPARAHAALRESLVQRRRLGDVRGVGLTLGLLAELAANDPEHARSLLERARQIFLATGDRPGLLVILLALGRHGAGTGPLEAAHALAETLGWWIMRGWAAFLLAESTGSARWLTEARRDFEACGSPWGLERCALLSERKVAGLASHP